MFKQSIVIVAAAAALVAACKKDEAKPEPAPATVVPAAGAPLAPTPAVPAAPEPDPSAKPAEPPGADPAMAIPPMPAPGPRPASVTDADVKIADDLVAAFSAVSTALGGAGADCKKAAAALLAAGPKLKAAVEAAEKIKVAHKGNAAAQAWFQATYVPKMMQGMAAIPQLAKSCASDAEFSAALQATPFPGRAVKHAPPAGTKGP